MSRRRRNFPIVSTTYPKRSSLRGGTKLLPRPNPNLPHCDQLSLSASSGSVDLATPDNYRESPHCFGVQYIYLLFPPTAAAFALSLPLVLLFFGRFRSIGECARSFSLQAALCFCHTTFKLLKRLPHELACRLCTEQARTFYSPALCMISFCKSALFTRSSDYKLISFHYVI